MYITPEFLTFLDLPSAVQADAIRAYGISFAEACARIDRATRPR